MKRGREGDAGAAALLQSMCAPADAAAVVPRAALQPVPQGVQTTPGAGRPGGQKRHAAAGRTTPLGGVLRLPRDPPQQLTASPKVGGGGGQFTPPVKNRAGEPEMPRPYRQLEQMFAAVDDAVSFRIKRGQPPTFAGVKPGAEKYCSRTITLQHVRQMQVVTPSIIRVVRGAGPLPPLSLPLLAPATLACFRPRLPSPNRRPGNRRWTTARTRASRSCTGRRRRG